MCNIVFFSQSYIEQGLFTFTYGQGDSVVDFVHVNNLVQAHVLAGEALHASKNAVAVSIWHSEKLCSHRITNKTTKFPLAPPPSIPPPTHNIGGWIITWLALKLLIVVKGWVSSWNDYRRIIIWSSPCDHFCNCWPSLVTTTFVTLWNPIWIVTQT